jgi:uncharacterized protein (DUF58 family)
MQSGLVGQYQSAFRGRGLEFEEVRDYRPGDDVRLIDWNVTARTGELYVKLYREERDLTVLLLVDLSASTRFGSGVMTVHDLIAEVSSLFALVAARKDRVGAILFDDALRLVIPPRRGWRHGLRVVREVLSSAPAGRGTALDEAIQAAGRIMHRRGVVIAVVDSVCELPRRKLAALAGRHDVVLVRITDPLERSVSEIVDVPVVDAESGRRWVLGPRTTRSSRAALSGVDVVDLSTDAEYLPIVQAMLERRERRHAR